MEGINLVDHFQQADHFETDGNPDLQERSILEIHKESLRRLFSNSESAFDQWKLSLDKLSTELKKKILDNFDEKFTEDLGYGYWLFEMKTLPKDWTRKYFCLLVYDATNQNEGLKAWEEKLQSLPTLVQNDVLQSLEKYFYPRGPRNRHGNVMYNEEVLNSSWVVKFMKLWEWDVHQECYNNVGLDFCEDLYMGDYELYYELNEKGINGGR